MTQFRKAGQYLNRQPVKHSEMNLPTKQQCIAFAKGLAVHYDEPIEVTSQNSESYWGMEVGETLPGEIILTDEMLAKLIEFCQTNQPQG